MTDSRHTPVTEAANHPLPSRPPPRRGRRFNILPDRPPLGAYRLCAEIATGGMATVYLAIASGQRLQQPVAIKRIHPHLAKDRTFVEMFYDEAAIASRIRHPNVCHVFDHDAHGGDYFMVMEYLLGEPLSRVARALGRRPDVDGEEHAVLCAAIAAEAARGLHAAHELTDENGDPLDVVHRDISPDNIFLTFDGIVKVVDFGVASASRQLHRTQTGMLKGKYAYLQPEVLTGARADRRGDVWGLGVVLWELLTLKRLFHRETDFQTLRAVADAPIDPPSTLVPEIPEELDAVVMKALSRDPNDRHATARDVEEALSAFVSSRGGSASPGRLAGWLRGLFPDGLARQRQFMEIALDASDEQATRAAPLPVPSSTPPPSVRPPKATIPPPPPLPGAGAGAPPLAFSEHPGDTPTAAPAVAHDASPHRSTGTRTPMVMHVEPPRARRAARLAPTILATLALALSIVALWSLESDSIGGAGEPARASVRPEARDTEEHEIGSPAGARFPDEAKAHSLGSDGADEPAPEASLRATAITLQLPNDVLDRRRPAQSPPIELGRGTYRLELTPHEGEWSVTIVPASKRTSEQDEARQRAPRGRVPRPGHRPDTPAERLEKLLGPSSGFFRPKEP